MGGDLKIRFGPSLTESGKEEVYQQIGRKVIWSIHNNAEKVKITLDPPDLGNIYMEIYREKEKIKATLWADNPTAKVALEASQTQLQKIMENQGFKLEQFNVFLHENMGSFQERKETPLNPHSWNPPQTREHEPEMGAAVDILPPRMLEPKFNSHHVDVLA
jgi:flagellar hook-length control protein FliK